jgi:spore coat protein U-like protein
VYDSIVTAHATGRGLLRFGYGLLVAPLLALLLPVTVQADAAPTTGTLLATATIEPGCRVVGQLLAITSIDLGSLNFGTLPSLFTTAVSAQSSGPSGILQVICTGAISVDVSISTGLHASGSQRQLASGANRVPYNLYVDSGLTTQFNGATARTLAVSPIGATTTLNMPIYGRIQPNPGVYAAGTYTDTVQITVTW